ncbi:MAG: cation transporter, partial [Selenomonadaceae bacterium]|nr:cation transporter [Selenomonadaceae bacterium]
DVLSTLVVMLAVKISGKPEDADHEYGHERFESIGAISLALMLAAVGLGI